ncbi:heme o synthase [Phycisphaerales bacterium]|nr:heme o synthase [Phycisphaerales bacterium]
MSNIATAEIPALAKPEAPARARRVSDRRGVGAVIEACKPGITRLVTVTSAVGFVMAALTRPWSIWEFAWLGAVTLVGTALSAAGANAINQWMERERDARMERTRGRPIPSGRIRPGTILWSGVGLSSVGVGLLFLAGPAPAVISLACVLSYVLWYTPLKTRTTLATFVGAIPGGLPPLIGSTAALGGGFGAVTAPVGLSLLAVMLIWQLPHFLAIAWMYREDYARGGYRVLPVIDSDGRWTSATMVLWAWALLPASLLPAVFLPDRLGIVYPLVAVGTGVVYAVLCARLAATRERAHAKQVFFASIAHLPILLTVMVGEGVVRSLV